MKCRIRHWVVITAMAAGLGACGAPTVEELLESAGELREQGRYESATAEYREVLEQEPDNAEARFGLGKVQLLSGQYGRAVSALRRAAELGIEADRVQPLLARALLWDGDADRLLEEINPEAVSEDAVRAEVMAYVGRGYLRDGRHEEAETILDEALALDRNSVTVLVSLSRLSVEAQDYEQAADYADRALAVDATSSAALFARADAARRLGDGQKAVDDYKSGLDARTPDISGREAFNARGQLVQTLLGLERMEEAKEQTEIMLRQASRHPYANYLAAIIAFREGDLSTATERGQTMLAATPNSVPGKLLMGSIRLEQEQYAQAVGHLREVVSAQPENREVRAMLAYALAETGQQGAAVRHLERALDGDDDFASRDDAIELMRDLQSERR